jgi:hypothetical protein
MCETSAIHLNWNQWSRSSHWHSTKARCAAAIAMLPPSIPVKLWTVPVAIAWRTAFPPGCSPIRILLRRAALIVTVCLVHIVLLPLRSCLMLNRAWRVLSCRFVSVVRLILQPRPRMSSIMKVLRLAIAKSQLLAVCNCAGGYKGNPQQWSSSLLHKDKIDVGVAAAVVDKAGCITVPSGIDIHSHCTCCRWKPLPHHLQYIISSVPNNVIIIINLILLLANQRCLNGLNGESVDIATMLFFLLSVCVRHHRSS